MAHFKHKEIGTNCNRINKTKPVLQHFNFENINYPLKKENYEMFEKNYESIYLLVFKPDDEHERVYYHFKSKFVGKLKRK